MVARSSVTGSIDESAMARKRFKDMRAWGNFRSLESLGKESFHSKILYMSLFFYEIRTVLYASL